MQKLKVALVGPSEKTLALYHLFANDFRVKVNLIINTDKSSTFEKNLDKDVVISNSLNKLSPESEIDFIFNLAEDSQTNDKLDKIKGPQIINKSGIDFIKAVSRKESNLYTTLNALIDSLTDGVIITDHYGHVLLINNAFKVLSDVSDAADIMGRKLEAIFPNNPILNCLRTGEKFSGQCYSLIEGAQQLSYVVNPIIINNKLTGAIGIFKLQADIIKLMEELQHSSQIIENLSNLLGSVNGLSEFNASKIISIDKMELILLRQALAHFGYTVEGKKKAAKALNISLATLYNKLKKHQFS